MSEVVVRHVICKGAVRRERYSSRVRRQGVWQAPVYRSGHNLRPEDRQEELVLRMEELLPE